MIQLILAGDIFEAWVGDDGATEHDRQFLEFCGGHSGDTLFIRGNRDFLIRHEFLQIFEIRLVEHLVCDGMIVIHGDELCTNDHAYQSFKQEVRQSAWIEQFCKNHYLTVKRLLRDCGKHRERPRPIVLRLLVMRSVQRLSYG